MPHDFWKWICSHNVCSSYVRYARNLRNYYAHSCERRRKEVATSHRGTVGRMRSTTSPSCVENARSEIFARVRLPTLCIVLAECMTLISFSLASSSLSSDRKHLMSKQGSSVLIGTHIRLSDRGGQSHRAGLCSSSIPEGTLTPRATRPPTDITTRIVRIFKTVDIYLKFQL